MGYEIQICKKSGFINFTVHKIVFSNESYFYLKKKSGHFSVVITIDYFIGEEILDLREEESMKGW